MRAVCIDFETANGFIGSACSVGIAVLEEGRIVDTNYWLIKPHPRYNYFDPLNVSIHGIQAQDVKDAPEFDFIYGQISPLFENAYVIAHNASFDMSVLRHVLDLYEIPYPELDYLCTYKTALKTWSGLDNYKLDTVCQFLNHDFAHHNALEDAIACGNVLLSALSARGVTTIKELAALVGMRLGKLYTGGYKPCSIAKRTSRKA